VTNPVIDVSEPIVAEVETQEEAPAAEDPAHIEEVIVNEIETPVSEM